MKTLQLKSLMYVAAVACLPVACGTSSPTGPDVSAIEASATVSALRNDPTPGPQAPWPGPSAIRPVVVAPQINPEPEPFPVPSPGGPSSIPTPSPRPAPQSPNDDNVPAPAPDGGIPTNIPVPAPGEPTNIPFPAPGSAPPTTTLPTPGSAPPTTTLPTPPATTVPPPGDPNEEPPTTGECLAVSVEIVASKTFAEPYSVALEAILIGKDGLLIEDSSCERLVWSVSGSGPALSGQAVIYVDRANSRLVSVSGPAGTYTVRVTTPNEQADTMQIDLF